MLIVLIGEALLRRSTISDGTILRDRVLSGFCVCPGPMKSHTPMGGNQLDSKRDEINPKSL